MNEIYVKIEGLNLKRIVSKLVSGGVLISNLKIKRTQILFAINTKYLDKLAAICKQEKKKFVIVKNTKIKRFFAQMPYFIGTFLPFCILFAVFYVFHTTIFEVNVSVSGLENFDKTEVEKILSNHNICIGESKNDLSPKEIEKIILANAKNVSGCSVFYEGRKLFVVISPAVIKEENLQKKLLSKYNAVVTKIEAFAGSQKVQVGDTVKAGDVLIESDLQAKGEAVGKVYFSATKIYSQVREEFVPTGEEILVKTIDFAGVFEISKPRGCAFENYEIEKVARPVFKNLFIPINEVCYVFKEVKTQKRIVPFKEVESEIRESLKCEAISKLPEGADVKDVTYSVVAEGDYTRIDCFVETEIGLF